MYDICFLKIKRQTCDPLMVKQQGFPGEGCFLQRGSLKDRHQWSGRELRCSLSLNMDTLFLKAIINVSYH